MKARVLGAPINKEEGLPPHFCRAVHSDAFNAFLKCKRVAVKLLGLRLAVALIVTELRLWPTFEPPLQLLFSVMLSLVALDWIWAFVELIHARALEKISARLPPQREPRPVLKPAFALRLASSLLLPWPIGFDLPAFKELVGIALPEMATIALLLLAAIQAQRLVAYADLNNSQTALILHAQNIRRPRLFLVKLVLESRGTPLSLTLVFATTVLFSLIMRIANHGDGVGAFDSLENSFYFTFVTMCTVGYGDLTPTRVLGKLLAMLLMALGIMLLPLFSSCLANELAMETIEERVFNSQKEREITNRLIERNLAYFGSLRRFAAVKSPWLQRAYYYEMCEQKREVCSTAVALTEVRAEDALSLQKVECQNRLNALLKRLTHAHRAGNSQKLSRALAEAAFPQSAQPPI